MDKEYRDPPATQREPFDDGKPVFNKAKHEATCLRKKRERKKRKKR